MKYTLKQFEDKNYIEYENDRGVVYDNIHYFSVNVLTDAFKKIMSDVGGFSADMTTRYIEEKNLDCNYIYFVPLPQQTNAFLFAYLYLDKKRQLLEFELDNNVGHFLYFKDKFKGIERYGVSYNLPYEKIRSYIYNHCSVDFGFEVDNKKIELEDLLVSKDFSIFNEKYRKSFNEDLSYYTMQLKLDFENNPVLVLTFYDKKEDSIKEYQYYNDDTIELDRIYHVSLPLNTLKVVKDVHLKEKV